jgi:hypothetical protein
MGTNLPDDTTPADIDEHYGGTEETFHPEVRIAVTVPNNNSTDKKLQQQCEDKLENALSLPNYHILSQKTTIEDKTNDNAHGSVYLQFPFTTVNKQDYTDFALKELKKNLDNSHEDIQFIEFI